MHRGTAFIITKDENNNFKVIKSTEFNGGMGLDCHGKLMYEMLKKLEIPTLFDAMIRDFDDEYFKYNDDIMTYSPDEQKKPYITENGEKYYEYSQTKNQFRFFKDSKGQYIYTSDSNYIKNMSDEDVVIVCCNGNFILKPNQILVADYDECINNSKISFGEKIDEKIEIDKLEVKNNMQKNITAKNNELEMEM